MLADGRLLRFGVGSVEGVAVVVCLGTLEAESGRAAAGPHSLPSGWPLMMRCQTWWTGEREAIRLPGLGISRCRAQAFAR